MDNNNGNDTRHTSLSAQSGLALITTTRKTQLVLILVGTILFSTLVTLYNQYGPYTPIITSTDAPKEHSVDDGNLARMVRVNEKTVSLPEGLRKTDNTDEAVQAEIAALETVQDAVHWYKKYCDVSYIECERRTRLGRTADGGWETCIVPPYAPRRPCLVYSFGINNDWSFDDAISQRYGCTVRSFDPSMDMKAHVHSPRVHFYPYGLGGKNEINERKWPMKTLLNITTELGENESIIDYLKLDIEFSEWNSFATMFEERVLERVKQLSFEAHALFNRDMTRKQWSSITTVFKQLDSLGFKKWYTHYNMHTVYNSKVDGNDTWSVYAREMGFLNMNYIHDN